MGATDWRTPPELFAELNREFCFTLDAAASAVNALLPRYYTEADDALAQDWTGERVYCNPPYSPAALLKAFVQKCANHAKAGGLAVMLLNTSTDVQWFHDFIWDRRLHRPREGVELRFFKGRIAFHGVQGTAIPSPRYANMLVVFHPETRP